ncbi:hypothetical protein [Paenibacillus sp. HGF7]|uniref:hypothetical protein n=1 Tax=Paenibacillus sp. HGF7 TaxID=944559 RepID=UPI00020D6BD2|nr:hypothetical protein [Paenibacillus sp. HGF7]EGL17081.1 hypothetical protein HMPREF9413_2612 [Paenibacillus sp. HGF7]
MESDPPYIYLPNGKIADHENKIEMEEAVQWGLSKGRELQARDGTAAHLVDKEIDQYLRTGTLLQAERGKQTKVDLPEEQPAKVFLPYDF